MSDLDDVFTHAPLPWRVTDREGVIELQDADGDMMLRTYRSTSEEEWLLRILALYRLFAAAPTMQAEIDRLTALTADLLAAVQAVRAGWEHHDSCPQCYALGEPCINGVGLFQTSCQLRIDAIAKAKGTNDAGNS